MTTEIESAYALIARTAELFEAWDEEDRAASEAALAAVFEALDEFRTTEPAAPEDPDGPLWTRTATLAEGLEEIRDRAAQRPFSPDDFQTAQLATYAALLQAQGRFD